MSSRPKCLLTQFSCPGSIRHCGPDIPHIQTNVFASIHQERERQEVGNGGARVWRESITKTVAYSPGAGTDHASIVSSISSQQWSSGHISYSHGGTAVGPRKAVTGACPVGQQISSSGRQISYATSTTPLLDDTDGPSVPTAPQRGAQVKYSQLLQACPPVEVQQKSTLTPKIPHPPCQKSVNPVSSQSPSFSRQQSAPGCLTNKQRRRNQRQQQPSPQPTPTNPEGNSRPLSSESPSFSRQQSAPGRLTNKQRRRNQRQLNMQHQLAQTRSYHQQHSLPVDNRRYSHGNPAQVLKLQKPPSSSEPSLAGR